MGNPRRKPALAPALLAGLLAVNAHGDAMSTIGRQEFPDHRNPPTVRTLDPAAQREYELGQTIFNTSWVIAGTPRAERRDGLGPLFIVASCDGCHNNGARGRGQPVDFRLSASFVMQLGGPPTAYGAVFNTQAIDGYLPEGRILLSWTAHEGQYADGRPWHLNEPQYRLTGLNYGPLAPDTVLRPRIAPALFGAGLLEAVPLQALQSIRRAQPAAVRGEIAWRTVDGQRAPGRFGWQDDAVSVEDQTARALAREMGLTSHARMADDCTPAQSACRAAPQGGTPEVSDEFMAALLRFQHELAVPPRRAVANEAGGAALFARVGCAACHQPELPISAGTNPLHIDAYTDLLLHDMGTGLADRTVGGHIVTSRWRTAPLWGLAHALQDESIALLHDGRAHSIEEAVLWHDGQARGARLAFEKLPAMQRAQLLDWVGSL